MRCGRRHRGLFCTSAIVSSSLSTSRTVSPYQASPDGVRSTSAGESQKAFNLLQKRLKPLEHYQPVPKDFYELAYLTSASTVHDAPSFRDWEGAGLEREKLVHVWRELVSRGNASHGKHLGPRPVELWCSWAGGRRKQPPPDRLVTLLKQAAAYQVLAARSRSSGSPWTIDS